MARRSARDSASTEYGFLDQLKSLMGVLGQHAAITAGQDHREVGMALADDGGQLHAVHPGHDHV